MLTIVHIRNSQITNKAAVRKLFDLEDGSYAVEVKKSKKRSNKLNAYYWGCVIQYVKKGLFDLGYDWTEDEVHEVIKGLFLKKKKELPNGQTVEVIGRTRDLNNEEFLNLLEKIGQWSAEYLSVVIPPPGEQITLNI